MRCCPEKKFPAYAGRKRMGLYEKAWGLVIKKNKAPQRSISKQPN